MESHLPRTPVVDRRQVQEEVARRALTIEQDRLDRLIATNVDHLVSTQIALADHRSANSSGPHSDDTENAQRLLAESVQRLRQRFDKLCDLRARKKEEALEAMMRAQEEARRLEEEEAAKLRAAQAEELAKAARIERSAPPPIRGYTPPPRHPHPPHRTPSFSYRYRPASPDSIAAARRAEEIRRYQERQEEIRLYQERQAARAAREAREAAAARKAFEEERKRLDEERRMKEEELTRATASRAAQAEPHRPGSPHNDSPPPSNQRTHPIVWSQVQKEVRNIIKTEQDRLNRLLATETENLRQAEEALAQYRARCSGDDPEYHSRLLADEEGRVQRECERIARLRADNALQLAHLIRQEMGRIQAAMIEDKLGGLLSPQQNEWVERNLQARPQEQERQAMERARKPEGGEETAKLSANQTEQVSQSAPPKLLVSPPMSDLNPESSLTSVSDLFSAGSVSSGDHVSSGTPSKLSPNPLPHPSSASSKSPTQHMDTRSEGTRSKSTRRSLTPSTDEASATTTAESARRMRVNHPNSKRQRAVSEEHLHVPHASPSHPLRKTASSSSSSRHHQSSSQENVVDASRRAREIQPDQERQEGIKHNKRSATRTTRETQKTGSVRNSWGERSQQNEEVRKTEEEQDQEQVVASWKRYEKSWQDLLSGASADSRQLTFYDIPWPVATTVRSFAELGPGAIEKFLLSPHHSTTKTRKMRLRAALMLWHPDKFSERFSDRMEESHRKAIVAGTHYVARAITELMNASE